MNFFNTMRVGTRLALGFGLLLVAMLAISALSLYELNVIGGKSTIWRTTAWSRSRSSTRSKAISRPSPV